MSRGLVSDKEAPINADVQHRTTTIISIHRLSVSVVDPCEKVSDCLLKDDDKRQPACYSLDDSSIRVAALECLGLVSF